MCVFSTSNLGSSSGTFQGSTNVLVCITNDTSYFSCSCITYTSTLFVKQSETQGLPRAIYVLPDGLWIWSCSRRPGPVLSSAALCHPLSIRPDTNFVLQSRWTHQTPGLAFVLTYILSAVLCFAVGIMLAYHIWTISLGETSVEGQDHEVYRKVAKSRGDVSLWYIPALSIVLKTLSGIREFV